ncbi:MAG: hypothetical protein ACRD6W_02660 [Nitrososphaerales archaeon]
MSGGEGQAIARRSVSLSRTLFVVGILMAVLSVLVSGLSSLITHFAPTGIPANPGGAGGSDLATSLPLVSIALQVFAAITFATPVLLLYVYDKNNGVLEYFLSLGMNQADVYRQYLKAALILCSCLVSLEVAVNFVAGLIEGTNGALLLEVSGLVVALAIPVVSLGTMLMMSFSSLQKQRVGANQPLGMAIGIIMVLPAYIFPLVLPSRAVEIDLVLALGAAALALLTYVSPAGSYPGRSCSPSARRI